MSKYEGLWKWVVDNDSDSVKLTFDKIEEIAGCKIDHSFLNYKKELLDYGYAVIKISMKEKTVLFEKQEKEKA